jgi:hypothetical protein
VGGKSAATGATLPSWENNPNALVKFGWLACTEAATARALKEIDDFVNDAQNARRDEMARLVADPRVRDVLDHNFLAVCERHAAMGEAGALCYLTEALVKALTLDAARVKKLEAELSELRASINAPVVEAQQRLLRAVAVLEAVQKTDDAFDVNLPDGTKLTAERHVLDACSNLTKVAGASPPRA